MMETLTIADLERLCRDYDRRYGGYPEHEYEGWAVLQFIRAKLTGSSEADNAAPDDWTATTWRGPATQEEEED
jgi:hypothetical protein